MSKKTIICLWWLKDKNFKILIGTLSVKLRIGILKILIFMAIKLDCKESKYIESTIATSGKDFGNDWNFDRHIIVDSKPTLEDFQKTITDYLSWEIQQVIKSDEKLGK